MSDTLILITLMINRSRQIVYLTRRARLALRVRISPAQTLRHALILQLHQNMTNPGTNPLVQLFLRHLKPVTLQTSPRRRLWNIYIARPFCRTKSRGRGRAGGAGRIKSRLACRLLKMLSVHQSKRAAPV